MSSIAAAKRPVELAKLVEKLRDTPRPLLQEEHDLIAGWMGWGAADQLFNPQAPVEWTTLGVELETHLPSTWIEPARAATLTSYFTDRSLADAIWSIATR